MSESKVFEGLRVIEAMHVNNILSIFHKPFTDLDNPVTNVYNIIAEVHKYQLPRYDFSVILIPAGDIFPLKKMSHKYARFVKPRLNCSFRQEIKGCAILP